MKIIKCVSARTWILGGSFNAFAVTVVDTGVANGYTGSPTGRKIMDEKGEGERPRTLLLGQTVSDKGLRSNLIGLSGQGSTLAPA